jgi:AmpD protein
MIIQNPLEKGNKYNTPKLIVVHCMGEFLLDPKPIHASDFLAKLGLSAHALIAPNGDVWVCRDDDQGAYHARGYNTDSLGVEFLVEGHHDYGSFLEAIKGDYITDVQWLAGVNAVKSWVEAYEIPKDKIVRHSDISPGRKVDPGKGFKWDKFLSEVV